MQCDQRAFVLLSDVFYQRVGRCVRARDDRAGIGRIVDAQVVEAIRLDREDLEPHFELVGDRQQENRFVGSASQKLVTEGLDDVNGARRVRRNFGNKIELTRCEQVNFLLVVAAQKIFCVISFEEDYREKGVLVGLFFDCRLNASNNGTITLALVLLESE